MIRLSATLLVALVTLVWVHGVAHAQPQVLPGELLVVLASNQAGAVDPSLREEASLRQPPFNSFQSMRVLERRPMRLEGTNAFTARLPNGRTIRIEVLGTAPDRRLRVRVSINRPNQTDYLPLLTVLTAPGDPFFVAGQSFQGGTLVVGVRVGARAPG